MTVPARRRPRGARTTATREPRRHSGAAAAIAVAIAAAVVTILLLEPGPRARAPHAPATAPVVPPYVDGVSDQNVPYWNGRVWSGGPPASPFGRFVAGMLVGPPQPATTPQPLRYARYVVAYDVACDPAGPAMATFERWLADVRALGLRPDVGFWYGDFDGNRCPALPLIPRTAAQYAAPVAAFLERFPEVRTIEPWNEPNNGHRPDVPPATAAAFWLAVAADCAARPCDAVIAGDFNDAGRDLPGYERRYVAALVRAGAPTAPAPATARAALDWGIHPYAAVNHLRETTLLEFLAGLPDRAADRIWYTEVGAFYCTRKRNPATGFGDARLQARQERRAHYLVSTLMAPPFDPLHVFYYEFMYKDDLPGPCATNDSALFAPAPPGAPAEYAPRAAVEDVFPFAAPPPPATAGGGAVFYAAVDWRPWRDGLRATVLPAG